MIANEFQNVHEVFELSRLRRSSNCIRCRITYQSTIIITDLTA